MGAICCAGTNSGIRLALVFLSWFLLHRVGEMGSADGSDAVATSGVSMSGRFIGWMQPHGLKRRSDALAVESGKIVKSLQTFAVAVGAAYL